MKGIRNVDIRQTNMRTYGEGFNENNTQTHGESLNERYRQYFSKLSF